MQGPLTDADFLAPALLNVGLWIKAYKAVRAVRARLAESLEKVPRDLDLRTASDKDLSLPGDMYSPLDVGVFRVRATTLSKVLHRKRPRFAFLYDRHIACVCQRGSEAPVPVARGRSWKDYAPLIGRAMRDDLQRPAEFWKSIAALRPGRADHRFFARSTWSHGRRQGA